ncbi:hypothetical protein RAB80_017604 [Fusarium oxysporum f. sp. vasinfectum]|uniref:Uncharacterized protein n=1 Tax=Fusarium oxysporum f. sp. vasinfectum 25433 TaxID=1089449 RepID=X0M4K5_FUSOX|nr:hypothetical protein FOTG_16049 [Fusarium oxysporum f. sp. vasinfectum 25433]KAK2667183.1 hypothetical protein RAB80_017604 [Fusarium oxysporum f. sp. vasinfectum]KAK2922743.1 hypothetical protein FoTM2_017596 [Fusarium oxysporum f. sp. vasinfectum]
MLYDKFVEVLDSHDSGACLGPPIEGHHRPCQGRNSPYTRVASTVADGSQDKRLIVSLQHPSISLIALIIGIVIQPVVVLPKSTVRSISALGVNQQSALIIASTDADPEFRKGLTLGDDVKLRD